MTLSLRVWDDPYDHEALAKNFVKIDAHDMQPGTGVKPVTMRQASEAQFDYCDYVIWDGQIFRVQARHFFSPFWIYMLQDRAGRLTSWIREGNLTRAGVCGECDGPTVEDYLCAQCRA